MGFSRQEYWSRLPCPLPGDLPGPRIQPSSLMSPALTGRFFTTSATREALCSSCHPTSLPSIRSWKREVKNVQFLLTLQRKLPQKHGSTKVPLPGLGVVVRQTERTKHELYLSKHPAIWCDPFTSFSKKGTSKTALIKSCPIPLPEYWFQVQVLCFERVGSLLKKY